MIKAFGRERVTGAIDFAQNTAMPSGYEVWIDGGTQSWSRSKKQTTANLTGITDF